MIYAHKTYSSEEGWALTKLKARLVVGVHAREALKGRGYAFLPTNRIGPEAPAAVLQRGGAPRGGFSATRAKVAAAWTDKGVVADRVPEISCVGGGHEPHRNAPRTYVKQR